MKEVKIGIVGLGTVGRGVLNILTHNIEAIENRLGKKLTISLIADRSWQNKKDIVTTQGTELTGDIKHVTDHKDIDIVVELIGGIQEAYHLTIDALKSGKHIVTANKALISTHGKEIIELANKNNLRLGFEASVAGGIPIIKAIKEGLIANKIESITGIINGTANFIMTKMSEEGGSFSDVLEEAKALGYAEADPTFDIEGIDAAHKLAILINLAFDTYISLDQIHTEGITDITTLDINFAKELGYKIKLLAIAKMKDGKVEARVHPTFISNKNPLATVDGVFNAVHVVGDCVGETMFYGPGAGMMPTASAVVSDIVDIAHNIDNDFETNKKLQTIEISPMDDLNVPYYLRFSVVDNPGVLSKVSGILGEKNISISSVIQHGKNDAKVDGENIPLVILTHHAKEKDMTDALKEIENLKEVKGKALSIRIEETIVADN